MQKLDDFSVSTTAPRCRGLQDWNWAAYPYAPMLSKSAMTALVQALRTAFAAEAHATGQSALLLGIAVSPHPYVAADAYNLNSLSTYVGKTTRYRAQYRPLLRTSAESS